MKVLIADDHWVVRESLKQVIRRLYKAHESFEAGTFGEALDILRQHAEMDLMLADLIMPGFDEFAGLKRLRAEFPQVPVVVVSVHEDREHVLKAVEHGVIGYIPKSADGPEIERAFERVLAGEVYFPRRLIEQPAGQPATSVAARAASPTSDSLKSLTNREREVVDLLGRGYSIQRIAAELNLSSHTVRVHVGNCINKLGLPDRSAIIHFAVNLANGAETKVAD
jgi:DNA-binding NarL/FixJ family response regulator